MTNKEIHDIRRKVNEITENIESDFKKLHGKEKFSLRVHKKNVILTTRQTIVISFIQIIYPQTLTYLLNVISEVVL